MNTEEMFLTISNRMDSIEAGLTDLNGRMDRLEDRLNGGQDTLDSRMNKLETGLNAKMDKLNSRHDKLETDLNDKMNELKGSLDSKILKLEVDALMELFLVRKEIHGRNKSLEKENGTYSSKNDNSEFAWKAEEYDKINTCLKAIEKIYQELKEKIG